MLSNNPIRLLLLAFTLSVGACAVKPDLTTSQNVEQNQFINQQWKIKGRLAIITPEERKSAYLSWRQENDEFAMSLNTLVGINIAKLQFDGKQATLDVDGDSYSDTSPNALLKRITGWHIPTSSMPMWMTGKAGSEDKTSFYDNGLLRSLTPMCSSCQNWEIQYEKYASFNVDKRNSLTLPSRLTLQGDNIKLIIRIDDWQAL